MTGCFFVFVGAKPPQVKPSNPGGQLSMSMGLCEHILSQGHSLEVIDTLQGNFPQPSLTVRLLKGVKRVYQLLILLNSRNITGVIIFSSHGLSFYERILMAGLCRLYRVKSVFFMLSGFFVADIERAFFVRTAAKILLKLPTVIGIQGQRWRSFYQKLGVKAEKMVTIRNWLPRDFLASTKPIERKPNEITRFCFVGWLVEEKGVRELFEAIKILSAQFEFEFVFIGGGTLEGELYEKILQNNLSKIVKMTGWLSSAEVYECLSTSHVFVLPSKAEGFPISLLEAMSLGLPAICTDVGAVADSLLDSRNGFLLKDEQTENIVRAMSCYLNNPELITCHSMESLRIFTEQHDRSKNCNILLDQFR